ncbi:uncharacterized protein LOC128897163 [Hylaeus anthracinus]|uniref:uncharacterized protein LOC128897163 n=1 Tax=Hylaeus anthracinus TaxID=313031 RepID=UPI0023B98797|nr:uncharacterized protein LOC128897163 [Hylaeus anthracinus]
MSTTQIVNPADIICGLKAAVTALECYHQMDVLQQSQQEKKRKPPPMYFMIPVEERNIEKQKKKLSTTCKTTVSGKDILSSKECISDTKRSGKDKCYDLTPGLKFPEMRNGYLYTRCYCVHRDGLQDSCPLSQCQGQPECLCKPWPICPPAKYLRCRYPKQYPAQ